MVVQRSIRWRLSVTGIVQGVGFRPFVHRLATELGLRGWVENNQAGVTIEAEGPGLDLAVFAKRLEAEAPPLARIESVEAQQIEPSGDIGFTVVASENRGWTKTLVSPDVATCDDCLREFNDIHDRRYRHPFINCTNCGPRYSIVVDVPYDRPNTTMSTFALCRDCRAEYDDPGDRRFHAQPVCCPQCGPRLGEPLSAAIEALRNGRIVALKGLGGYHLAVAAADAEAVARLRSRKHREEKPFALMVPDLATAERLCHVDRVERRLLTSMERPIVLLRRRSDPPVAGPGSAAVGGPPVAPGVAPGSNELGLMLPYTPIHHLVLGALGQTIVCTSANLSDEPIAYRDRDARTRLQPIADSFVVHDRPIHIRVDDSVVRVVGNRPYPIRRSRGYAPAPIAVANAAPRPILACGAELKNTIAYARDRHVFVSHHIGDLKTAETFNAFREAIDHLGRLFEIEPQLIAGDLHPDYLSTGYVQTRDDLVPVPVQHHHAHIAGCLGDAGHDGPVIGVAFDGMGLGDDGTIWGGEFLVADQASYTRVGWFEPVPMPGGDAATREPWRMAASYLDRVGEASPAGLAVAQRNEIWNAVVQIGRAGANSPLTSSVGRLFDAVAALLGVRDRISYEGQAAIELEQLADGSDSEVYLPAIVSADQAHVVQGTELVSAALHDLRRGVPAPKISMRFHRGLARSVVQVCERIRLDSGLQMVALSGGVFLNRVLLMEAIGGLEAAGFTVLRHRQVPCNDGGISFGQAIVAAARDRAGLLER